MFSLLITVISVALTAALALTAIFYGGAAYTRATAEAQAARFLSQGQQLLGAADMYHANHGAYPLSLQQLVDSNYLRALPVATPRNSVSSAHASDATWEMAPGSPLFSLSAAATKESCIAFNKKVPPSLDGVLKQAYVELSAQCFGTNGEYTVMMKKSGETTFSEVLFSEDQIATKSLDAARPDPEAWDTDTPEDLPEEEPEVAAQLSITALFRPLGSGSDAPLSVSGDYGSGAVTANFLDPGVAFLIVRNENTEPETFPVTGGSLNGSLLYTADDYVALGRTQASADSNFTLSGTSSCKSSTTLQPGETCSIRASIEQGPPGTEYPAATVGTARVQMGFTPNWQPVTASKLWSAGATYIASGGRNWALGVSALVTDPGWAVNHNNVFTPTVHDFIDIAEYSGLQVNEQTGAYYRTALFVKPDGTLWGAGKNVSGEFGNGTDTPVEALTQLSITGVSKVFSSGGNGTWVIKDDGTLWGAGFGTGSSLGANNFNWVRRVIPEPVVDGALWDSGMFALAASGNLYYRGRFNGVASTTDAPIMTDVARVVAHKTNVFVVKTDGTVLARGVNRSGQLGNGMKGPFLLAETQWYTVFNGAVNVFTTDNSPGGWAYITDTAGRLWVAGSPSPNGGSALGLGSTVEALTFTLVPGITNVVSVAGNGNTAFALRSDGTVWRSGRGGVTQMLRSYYINTTHFVQVYF